MKNFFICCFFCGLLPFGLFAQRLVPTDIIIDFPSAAWAEEGVLLGGLSEEEQVRYSQYDAPYQMQPGFQYIFVADEAIPVHIEQYDNFVVFLEANSKYIHFGEGRGAVKNNYLKDRYHILNDIHQDSSLIAKGKDAYLEVLSAKRDSLVTVASKLLLSDDFMESERKFWDYHLKFYELAFSDIIAENRKLRLTTTTFPEIDYNNPVDANAFLDYRRMATHYYFQKLEQAADYERMEDLYNSINSDKVLWLLDQLMIYEVGADHPKSAWFVQLLDKESDENYRDEVDVMENHLARASGMEFPVPRRVKNYLGERVKLHKAKKKPSYVLIYDARNSDLVTNFVYWNRFFVEHHQPDKPFFTIGMNARNLQAYYKQFFLKNKIAGLHLSISNRRGEKLLEELGIIQLPIILELDQGWNIVQLNHSFGATSVNRLLDPRARSIMELRQTMIH